MRIPKILFILFLLFPSFIFSQNMSPGFQEKASYSIDRLSIQSRKNPSFFTALKYYQVKDMVAFASSFDTLTNSNQDLDYLKTQYNYWINSSDFILEKEKSGKFIKDFFSNFYRHPNALFESASKDHYIELNPLFQFGMGKDSYDNSLNFLNQRGLAINAMIDNKVYFYTHILESQARFTSNIRDRFDETGVLLGAGFVKNYNSLLFDIEDGNDFLLAQAHLGFNLSKNIDLQFGHGRNFIGNGYRSLLLSDRSPEYLYLKLNWKFGKKIILQNIFAELTEESNKPGPDVTLPKKYMAAHYLGFKFFDQLDIGFFEAVIFDREEGFELQYLNPIIFYRTVEGMIGSPDNVLLGADFKWNLPWKTQLYGQLLVDEIKFDELFVNNEQWWANKWGIQLGLKAVDAFTISNLDFQFEFNTVRPYTYAHRSLQTNYSHYEQELAHPLGANFREFIARANYRVGSSLALCAQYISFLKGLDDGDLNYGGNIMLPYDTRVSDYGNNIGQGVKTNVKLLSLDLTYSPFHNIFIDLNYIFRREDREDENTNRNINYFGATLRMNIDKYPNDF